MTEIASVETAAAPATPPKKRKYKMSAENRKKLAAAAKQRWAAKKAVGAVAAVAPVSETPTIVAPPPTPPAVLMLQEDVVRLIRSRSAYREELLKAQSILAQAQAQFQTAQNALNAVEQEVQYLHAQIGQMQGQPAQPQMLGREPFYPMTINPAQAGIGSIPSPAPIQFPQQPTDGVNRAHADRSLAMV